MIGVKDESEKDTVTKCLLGDIKTVRGRVSTLEQDKRIWHFLNGLQFLDSKGKLVSEVDGENKRGDWKNHDVGHGEQIVGFFGELSNKKMVYNLGLVLAR